MTSPINDFAERAEILFVEKLNESKAHHDKILEGCKYAAESLDAHTALYYMKSLQRGEWPERNMHLRVLNEAFTGEKADKVRWCAMGLALSHFWTELGYPDVSSQRRHDRHAFKVGDTVRITGKAEGYNHGWENNWPDEMDQSIGTTCKILDVDKNDGFQLDNYWWYPSYVLELVKPEPKFKIGDEVRVLIKTSRGGLTDVFGAIGKVERNIDHLNNNAWVVKFNNRKRGSATFYDDDLELVTKGTFSTFQVGDKVRVLRKDTRDNASWLDTMNYLVGKTGEISNFELQGARVEFEGFKDECNNVENKYFLLDNLELAPAKHAFKVGDRVVLGEDKDPRYPGTVTKVFDDHVIVDWDRGEKGSRCDVALNADQDEDYNADNVVYLLDTSTLTKDVIALVVFAEDDRRTPKAYEYLVERKFDVRPGDVLSVNTPYGPNRHVTVQDVYEQDRQMYKGKLKAITKRVRRGNPEKFTPLYTRDSFKLGHQEGRGLVGKRATMLIGDKPVDFTDIERRIAFAIPDGTDPYGAVDFKTARTARDALGFGHDLHARLSQYLKSTSNLSETTAMFKITKPTLVNGYDVKDIADDKLIEMIDANVKTIETLEKQNERVKTKVLSKRIADLQADTDELRALLDSRYTEELAAE